MLVSDIVSISRMERDGSALNKRRWQVVGKNIRHHAIAISLGYTHIIHCGISLNAFSRHVLHV